MTKTRYICSIIDKLTGNEATIAKKLMKQPHSAEVKKEYKLWIEGSEKKEILSEIEEVVSQFLPNEEHDKRDAIVCDVLASTLLYGVSPLEYFQFEFQNKSDCGRNEYFSDAEKFIVFRSAYDFSKYELVRNKWNQYSTLSDLFARDCVLCSDTSSNEEKEKFLAFLMKHPVFVFKPLRASCGKGVRIIDSKCTGMTGEQLYDALCAEKGIADQQIVQDKRMECLHPGSVNTIRLVAVRDRINNKNYYTQSLVRMGRGDAIIDNYLGAIRARVDTDSGIAYTLGLDGYGSHFIFHPDTGVQIVGFAVPEWKQLIEAADKALHRMEDYARYIGFDFALSEDGWKIVEVNPFPQIFPQQMTVRMGSRDEMLMLSERCK